MILGFTALTVSYFSIIATFDTIQSILNLPPSAREYCPNNHPCWRADLLAFEVTSGLCLAWCGWAGLTSWHIHKVQHTVPKNAEGRLFGYLEVGDRLTAVSTTFQLFDLMVSLLIPEQRQPLFLCHHIMAATVSWYGLNNQVRVCVCLCVCACVCVHVACRYLDLDVVFVGCLVLLLFDSQL
jgi:hypothetical protein